MRVIFEIDLDDQKILAKTKDKKGLIDGANRLIGLLQTVVMQLETAVREPDPGEPCSVCGEVHEKSEPPEVCPEHGTVFAKHEGCPLCTELVRTEAAL